MHGKSSDFARHPPPRLPVPGTGVFLPPGSGNSSSSQQLPGTPTEVNFSAEPVPSQKRKMVQENLVIIQVHRQKENRKGKHKGKTVMEASMELAVDVQQ
jgi:hypothetical protein